jgi:dextranase
MQIVQFTPTKGCYLPGETVKLRVEIESTHSVSAVLVTTIQHLDDAPNHIETPLQLLGKREAFVIEWQSPLVAAGYGAKAELRIGGGIPVSQATVSFDVLPAWSVFPRYGYLTDFSAGRSDADETLATLTRFHINGLQFYDWQYRHDELLAPSEAYLDPLGREMSLSSVKKLVEAAGRHGMAAMPYLAVYAASAAFWRSHPEAALYDQSGQPIPFGENFLGLMNPANNSSWRAHLLAECARTLEAIPFNGLHIDQYGEPKQVWDSKQQPVDLPVAFANFIAAARADHPEKTILFNAVGNWPIEALANSPLDFMYIEIWPPDVRYRDVARIVLDAVRLSGGKPVVIALYLPAHQPQNVMQANAVIAACGGTRIELGESERLLADPYFPNHHEIPLALRENLLRHYDFLVRYGEWMQSYPLSTVQRKDWSRADFQPDYVGTSQSVWVVAHRYPNGLALNLVNFNGLDPDLQWDELHHAPIRCQDLSVQVRLASQPAKILWACPEMAAENPQALTFEYQNGYVSFVIPTLHLSGVVFIHE